MAACRHGGMLSTSAPNHNVQLACNEEWIAFSEKENSFGIYNHEMTNEKVSKYRLEIKHHRVFQCMQICSTTCFLNGFSQVIFRFYYRFYIFT